MDASVSLAEVPNCQSSYVRGGLFPSSHDGEKCQMEPASMALPFPSHPFLLAALLHARGSPCSQPLPAGMGMMCRPA